MLHHSQVQFRGPSSQNPVLIGKGSGSIRDIIFAGVRQHFCLFVFGSRKTHSKVVSTDLTETGGVRRVLAVVSV